MSGRIVDTCFFKKYENFPLDLREMFAVFIMCLLQIL